MYLVREVMYCRPGKVRALTDKFLALSKLMQKAGLGSMRVMTDFSAERFWTVVGEMEAPSLDGLEKMLQMEGMPKEVGTQLEKIMEGYHDLVDHGRREIYRIEG